MRTGDTKEDVGEILDDPQMCGAYVSEIYEYLRELEDLSKKRKHQPSSVPSEESCMGENRIPVPAILHRNRVCTLLDLGSAMSSSQNRPRQYDQEKMANWRFPLNPITMRVCFLLGNSDGFSGSHKPLALIDLSLAIIFDLLLLMQ
ncbi:hypothetical protein Vadar_014318 [Vaccinium darrowii]|nr:hypothetical protein Vadar_014318 [Vaccinium darrowii]